MKPFISVVISLFNDSQTINSLMDIMCSQPFDDIEYICVDDCSTDDTISILEQYARSNPKITIIQNDKSIGLSASRMKAISTSIGKYVMPFNGSDAIQPECFKKTYDFINGKEADVLQYSIRVNKYISGSTDRTEANRNTILCPSIIGSVSEAESIAKTVFLRDKSFKNYLQNKAYNGDIARKVANEIIANGIVNCDYCFNLLFSLEAKSYIGIRDIMNTCNANDSSVFGKRIDLNGFEARQSPGFFRTNLSDRLNECENDYSDVVLDFQRHSICDALNELRFLRENDLSAGFERIINAWSLEGVADALSCASIQKKCEYLDLITKTGYFTSTKKTADKKITIASYYPKLTNGGIERVMCNICSQLAEATDDNGNLKYKVILITDHQNETENNIEEYEYSNKVIRERIPSIIEGESFKQRFLSWNRIINQYDVDIVVGNMWASSAFLADAICIKGNPKRPFLVQHFHNFVGELFRFRNALAEYTTKYWQFIDGVIVLSETDKEFVKSFTSTVEYIPNPMTFEPVRPNGAHGSNVLWAGRFAKEKRPVDAVLTAYEVIKEAPEAKFYIVGSGKEYIEEEVNKLINELKLENNIIVTGFSDDVGEFYKNAAVFVSTSSTEGYGLTLYEAISFGVPVIMYDLPWLSLVEDGRGVVTVSQNDTIGLATEIVKVLKNDEHRNELSKSAFEHAKDMHKMDIVGLWNGFIEKTISTCFAKPRNDRENILLRMITGKQNESKTLWNTEYEELFFKSNYYRKSMEEYANLADRMRLEASENWKARNKAIEEASENWKARNKAIEEASENWKARNEAIKKQAYAWNKRNEAIAEKNKAIKEKKEIEIQLDDVLKTNAALKETCDYLEKNCSELKCSISELEKQYVEIAKEYKEITEHWSYKLFMKKTKKN